MVNYLSDKKYLNEWPLPFSVYDRICKEKNKKRNRFSIIKLSPHDDLNAILPDHHHQPHPHENYAKTLSIL